MTYSIVYSNEGGNTEMLARHVYSLLDSDKCIYIGKTCDEALRADIIFTAFWTDKGSCDGLTKRLLEKITTERVFILGSAGFGISEDYFKQILLNSEANVKDKSLILGSFVCQGRMKMRVLDKYMKAKEENPTDPKYDMLINNFNEALKHPNEDDLNRLGNEILKACGDYGITL